MDSKNSNPKFTGERHIFHYTFLFDAYRTTLVVCAHSAVKVKDSYFHAQFQRISVHRGKKRAYVAVAHSLLIAIYHVLKDGVEFKDLGAEYYNQFNKERKIKAYLKKLKALGWEDLRAMIEQPA